MTSHFGIVVVDSNKRGENEALNDEEKRQMFVFACRLCFVRLAQTLSQMPGHRIVAGSACQRSCSFLAGI
jgi:hypothetical protein